MTPPKHDDARQVATRISADTFETLKIAMLVEGVDSMQDLLRPIVEEYARRIADEPEVIAIRTSATAYQDRKLGIHRLPPGTTDGPREGVQARRKV